MLMLPYQSTVGREEIILGFFSRTKIENIKDIDEFFVAPTKRKQWNCISQDILRQIFDNVRFQ
jgi:hypothetical protein